MGEVVGADAASRRRERPHDARGRRPSSFPFAPGKRPNRLSKVRFSLMRNTTCLIGVVVSNSVRVDRAAGGSAGPDPQPGRRDPASRVHRGRASHERRQTRGARQPGRERAFTGASLALAASSSSRGARRPGRASAVKPTSAVKRLVSDEFLGRGAGRPRSSARCSRTSPGRPPSAFARHRTSNHVVASGPAM